MDDSVAEHLVVLRAQLGSRDAFARLATAYDGALLFYLRRLIGVSADAEDVRQEVWLTVIRKLHTLDDPSAFRAWLYQVARRRAISFLRRARREVPIDEVSGADEPRAADDDEEDFSFTAADAAATYAALDDLSAAHREVLTLRYLGGLTYEQLASVLGCPVGTARSRLHYAKAALRAALPVRAADADLDVPRR